MQPCHLTMTSAAHSSSHVVPLPAPRGRDFVYPHSQWQAHRGICSPWPCPCRPIFLSSRPAPRLEWGRSEHFSSQRPVAAAPAQLRARGYRSLPSLGERGCGVIRRRRLVQWRGGSLPIFVSGRRSSLCIGSTRGLHPCVVMFPSTAARCCRTQVARGVPV